MSSELFLAILDFKNKFYHNTISFSALMVEANCSVCGRLTYVNHMYGRQYPLCREHYKIKPEGRVDDRVFQVNE